MSAELYDADFEDDLAKAKDMISRLSDKQDKRICAKWISRLRNFDSEDLLVKKNRNAFMKYLMRVIRQGIMYQPIQVDLSTEPETDSFPSPGVHGDGLKEELRTDYHKFMCHWSPDKRTYVAVKPLPGSGTLIYMAVSKDPEAGWDLPPKTM